MKFRIIEKTINDKEKYYIIQQKFLFWWFNTRFDYIGYYESSSHYQFTDVFAVAWETEKQAKFIIENYKEHEYKGYIIYPCITSTIYNQYILSFYIDMGYEENKCLGDLEFLKKKIDNWTQKDKITEKIVYYD